MSCSLFCASVLVVGVGSICGSPGAGLGAAPGALASGNARRAPATKRLWRHASADERLTATPIKHLVVVFLENTGMFSFASRRPPAPPLFLNPSAGEPSSPP